MLYYPKMPGSRNAPVSGGKCWAFEKYDGTNLHFEWERDFGWHGFGTRRDAFNLTDRGIAGFEAVHANLAGCARLFLETLAPALHTVFIGNLAYRNDDALSIFAEYLGPNSFAGLHHADDPKRLVLFDVWIDGVGFVGPEAFVRDFGHFPFAARVVYHGKMTGRFTDDVRTGKYGVAEGVVCKGGTGGADVWMVKVKTHAFMEKLKAAFAQNWENYWE